MTQMIPKTHEDTKLLIQILIVAHRIAFHTLLGVGCLLRATRAPISQLVEMLGISSDGSNITRE